MKKINVALFGEKGRMGRELLRLLDNSSKFKLSPPEQDPDVVIDFSSPAGAVKIAKWCAEKKIPLVTGTTGLSESEETAIDETARVTKVFSSSNMSLGVGALAEVLRKMVHLFPATEIEIEEFHHRKKKDAPSGTAKMLRRTLEDEGAKVLQVKSFRAGEIFGIHRVYFFSDGEWIVFEHQATDRKIFAQGALRAAEWLLNQKKAGRFNMRDLLKDIEKT